MSSEHTPYLRIPKTRKTSTIRKSNAAETEPNTNARSIEPAHNISETHIKYGHSRETIPEGDTELYYRQRQQTGD